MPLKNNKRIGANKAQLLKTQRVLRKDRLKVKAHRLSKAGILICAVLAVCTGMVLGGKTVWKSLASSKYLEIQGIEIHGNKYIRTEIIMRALRPDTNGSIVSIDEKELRDRLRVIEWFKKVRLEKTLSRKLKVTVIEFEPVAWLHLGTEIFLLSKEGTILNAPEGMMFNLPVLSGLPNGLIENKTVHDSPEWDRFKRLITALGTVDPTLPARLSEVIFSKDSFACVTTTGIHILLPFEYTKERLENLVSLMDRILKTGSKVHEIDLTYTQVAYVR
jgi:cell division septal protein FtsQ